MYIVYSAINISVSQMTELWGANYRKITGIEQAAVQMVLKAGNSKYSKLLPPGYDPTARVVHVPGATEEALAAMNFTGAMQEEKFQVIGGVSDDTIAKVMAEYKKHELETANQLLERVRESIERKIMQEDTRYHGASVNGKRITFVTDISQTDMAEMIKSSHNSSVEKIMESWPDLGKEFIFCEGLN